MSPEFALQEGRVMSDPVIKEHGAQEARRQLNKDLVERLDELIGAENMSSDCWNPARPMVIEALIWVASAATIWGVTLLLFR
jgi:hypothetical protein